MGPAACRGCLAAVHCCLTKLSIAPPVLIRLLPLALALSSAGSVAPALANSSEIPCNLSRHDHTIPLEKGPGTPQVPWPSAQAAIPKPKGWANDNFFLGRWQGQSTAGRAVIDVLTVEPNRIRWGNKANGICDSDYSVENLPWGRNGRYPDQLVPPSQPTDLVFGVARLTLRPGPCSTGDAVIQLAMPLDGSSALEVVTYDAKGQVIGKFGAFERLPAAGR